MRAVNPVIHDFTFTAADDTLYTWHCQDKSVQWPKQSGKGRHNAVNQYSTKTVLNYLERGVWTLVEILTPVDHGITNKEMDALTALMEKVYHTMSDLNLNEFDDSSYGVCEDGVLKAITDIKVERHNVRNKLKAQEDMADWDKAALQQYGV